MLNKKPIAVLAAGATLASGLAFAAPALAKPVVPQASPTQEQTEPQELKSVVFNFKVGDVDHKTEAITLYKKGDKYGATKDVIDQTAAQIGGAFLAKVQNELTPADTDIVNNGEIDKMTLPTEIKAGENVVAVTLKFSSDFKDPEIVAIADSGASFDAIKKALVDNKKKISPAQFELLKTQLTKKRAAQQKPYEEAAKAAKLINDGSIEATKEEKKAAADFLEATKAFAGKSFDELTDAEALKAGSEAVKLNNNLSAALRAKLPELEKAIAEAKNSLGFGYPLSAIMRNGAETPADGTMYRLYNPWTGEHLFTINPQEKDNDVAAGWTFERTVGKALLEKGDPVYRLLNPSTGEHHYTMNENEVKTCVANGWKDEGVVFYSAKKDDKGAIAMISLYNPYNEAFYHHYTSDEGEIRACVADGWKNEGPKFYLVK